MFYTKELKEHHINELYDFIVGSNLERAFCDQCSKANRLDFEEWFGIKEE